MFNNGWRQPCAAMSSWLNRIGAGLVLKHPEMLDHDWVPKELVGRDEQLENLAGMFTGIDGPSGSGRAVITGPVGSGKSVLSRVFTREISTYHASKRDIRWMHVNCRNNPSESQVLQRIIHELDPRHPDRGLGVGEILSSIRRLLRSESAHMIIILDEVDHLMRKSGDALIYRLLRIDEEYGSSGTLSLILISQEQILDMFESAVISRFGYLNHLRLDGYDVEGLFKIACQRAEMAFTTEAISESVLRLIAEAAAPSGDARVVIDLLTNSSRLAEKDGRGDILSSDVQKLSMKRPENSNDNIVDELSAHAMLLLIAICRRLKNTSEISSGDAVSLYKVVCEEYVQTPRGHTTLWKHLKRFEELDLLKVRAGVVLEGRGRTQHFSMPHLLPVDIAERLETQVKARLRR